MNRQTEERETDRDRQTDCGKRQTEGGQTEGRRTERGGQTGKRQINN